MFIVNEHSKIMNAIIEKCLKQLNSIDLQAATEVVRDNRFDFRPYSP